MRIRILRFWKILSGGERGSLLAFKKKRAAAQGVNVELDVDSRTRQSIYTLYYTIYYKTEIVLCLLLLCEVETIHTNPPFLFLVIWKILSCGDGEAHTQ